MKRKKAISIKNAELRVDNNGFIEIVERDKEGEIINVIDMVNVANSFANTSIKRISEFAKSSIKTTGSYLCICYIF